MGGWGLINCQLMFNEAQLCSFNTSLGFASPCTPSLFVSLKCVALFFCC